MVDVTDKKVIYGKFWIDLINIMINNKLRQFVHEGRLPVPCVSRQAATKPRMEIFTAAS